MTYKFQKTFFKDIQAFCIANVLVLLVPLNKGWYLKDYPPLLSIYVQNSSTPLTLDVQFQPTPPPLPASPNDKQSVKRKHNPRMTMYVIRSLLQVGFCFQYQLINLIWLSFDLFSFSWSRTMYFFVALCSCVCRCPKVSRNVFYL